MPRFRPRDLRQATLEELRRQLNEIQKEISSDIDLLARRGRTTELQLGDYAAAFGDLVRMAAPATGARLILPEPLLGRVGDRVTLASEAATGAVTVEVVSGTINGQDTLAYPAAVYTAEFVLTPDGWFSAAGAVASSAVLDAEFVVGAAHATLPNGRVATDSTEIDAVLTTPNVISWALNLASVAFSKLANLAGLSVLGRSANSTGVMAAITASAARQVLRDNDAGTALEWGFPVEVRESGIDQGDVYILDRRDGRATVSAGVATLGPPGQVSDTQGGTLNAYTLPATLRHGDTLSLIASSTITLNGIDATSVAAGFGFYLNFSDGGVAGRLLIINDESGSATATNRISTLDDIQMRNPTGSSFWVFRAATRWGIVDRSIVEVQDDGASQGFVRTLNALSSTTNAAVATVSAGVAALSYQRAALTGDVTATANSNATTIANDAVTNAKLANMTAGTAKGRLHSAGTGDPQDLTRLEQGQNIRAGEFQLITVAGGTTTNNQAINDGVTQVFITVTGAGVATFTGFNYASGSFAGAHFKVVRSVNSAAGTTVRLTDEGLTSTDLNRIWLPGRTATLDLTEDEDNVSIGRDSGTASTTRWRIESDARVRYGGIRDNGTLETSRGFLNLVSSTSVTLTGTQDSANDEIEVAAQRAALSGAIAATANSNATLFAGILDNGSAENDRTNLNFLNNAAGAVNLTVTDDSGNDELEITATYVGTTSEVVVSAATGNLGTIDISALACGGCVRIASDAVAAHQIEGFTAKSNGFWFMVVSDTAQTTQYLDEDATATAANRMRLRGAVDSGAAGFNHAVFMYSSSRWRGVVGSA